MDDDLFTLDATDQLAALAKKKVSAAELLKAAKILKIDKVIFLGLPDAAVKENAKKFFEKALPIVKKIAPDHILSFGPDGMTGHLDHITVGRVARRVAKKLKIPMAAATMSDERIAALRKEFFAYIFAYAALQNSFRALRLGEP